MLVIDRDADEQGARMIAALSGVVVVDFDSVNDSTEVAVSKIEKAYAANGSTPLPKLAFAGHGGKVWQLASDCICHLGPDGYNIADAVPVISALVRCVAKQGGRIDLLGCRLLALDPRLPDKLENEFEGIQFTASDDDTGNRSAGGDWVMESDGLDISADYFDAQRLKAYTDTMRYGGGDPPRREIPRNNFRAKEPEETPYQKQLRLAGISGTVNNLRVPDNVVSPGTYYIRTCEHAPSGHPAGWNLASWKDFENRDHCSAWVYVTAGTEWASKWEISPGKNTGTYRIKFHSGKGGDSKVSLSVSSSP